MRRRYLPPHKVAKLADPSAKQTGIAYHHLFSFFQGLLLLLPPFISSLFFQLFSFLPRFCFLSLCRCVLGCFSCFVFFCFFREGCFLFFVFSAARDCHSNHDFASWLSGALLSLNRYFRHLRMCARLHYVVKCVFLYLASPLRLFFLGFFFFYFAAYSCAASPKPFRKEPLKSNNRAFFPSRCNSGLLATWLGVVRGTCQS